MKGTSIKFAFQQPPKRVLVSIHIGVASAREVFSGVVTRVNANYPWVIDYEFNREKAFALVKDDPERYAGVIAEAPGGAGEFQDLAGLGVPVVFTKNVSERRLVAEKISFLCLDEKEVGREAFRQLAKLGRFGAWVFVPDPHGRRFSRMRSKGFSEAITKRYPDAKPVVINWAGGPVRGEAGDEAIETLRRLPRPLAFFAVNDNTAINVLGLCRLADITVPGQAMVLGVDNDTMVCLNTKPTLSSIQPDHFALGESAADELARLMNGGRGRAVTIRSSIKAFVHRDSTRYLPPAEHLVKEGLAFIAENASRAISVSDVAAHLRVSRPLLDLRFRQLRGGSVGAAIVEARLAEVKRRLADTRASATEIALDCGFGSVSAMSHFFVRAGGFPPSKWRHSQLGQPAPLRRNPH